MTLISYSSFILAFVLIFNTSVLLYLVFSYRKRHSDLKERTDKTITHLDQQLERSGIVLAETRKKVRTLENELSYYKNGGIDPGFTKATWTSSTLTLANKNQETNTATYAQEEARLRRNSETTSTSVSDPMLQHHLFAMQATNDVYPTRPASVETVDKPAYQPYVSSSCNDRSGSDYSSSDSSSSSSDSCSSSSND